MSALRRQTYANDTQPLFMPIGGGTFTGDIVVDGDITTQGGSVKVNDGATTKAQLGFNGVNGYVACNSGARIYFGGTAGLPGQSYIQPSGTTNQDLLNIGGVVSARQLKLQTGVDALIGNGTLLNGTATITTTGCIGVNSFIFLTRTNVNASTALGDLRIQQKNVGSFLVESSTMATPPLGAETGDQSDFSWVIINPA